MHRVSMLAACAALAVALIGCGGGDSPSTLDSSAAGSSGTGTGTGTGTGNGGTTTQTPVYSMGNGVGSSFQSGAIGLSSTNLAAGGSTSLTVNIVDQTGTLYTSGTPVSVTINSPCLSSGLAILTASGGTTAVAAIGTTSGTVDATYTAKGCSGADVITATATLGSQSLTATGTVTVAAASVGSIQFVSATPSSIGLKGTGLGETSTVIFKVVDSTGGARPGVDVTFSLNTTVGGLTLSPTTATSGADGTVQTVVSPGTQHTSVRVTAVTTATGSSPSFSTQSSVLTVTTGLPASDGFSIAVGAPSYAVSGQACTNVEAYGTDGVTVPVTVRLADRYNNPAPDGTSIAFTTDGGHIVGSCVTPSSSGAADGTCSVNWTSANPRPGPGSAPPAYRAGRVQILATTIGEESFDDANGNGYWDPGETFTDLGEPYRDDNESGAYDLGEYFLDFNKNGVRDAPDGTFKGITCTANTCSTTTLAIGAQHLMIMSTAGAIVQANPNSITIARSVSGGATNSLTVLFTVSDTNGNPMAAGTTVVAAATGGTGSVSGVGSNWTIGCRDGGGPDTSNPGYESLSLTFTAGTSAASGEITITVTSPGTHTATVYQIPVTVT